MKVIKKILTIGCLLAMTNIWGETLRQQTLNAEVDRNLQGDFGELKRSEVPNIPLGTTQHAWDKSDKGIHTVEYDPNKPFKIRLREHMNTTIRLPKWEKVRKVLIGDKALVTAHIVRKDVVILYPTKYVGADTNVSIVANGHTYLFYVRVEGHESNKVPDIGVNVKAYPPRSILEEDKALKKEVTDWVKHSVVDPENMDWQFSMSGDASIVPRLVYSDGIRTWLYYGENISKYKLPAIFRVIDGVDVPAISFRQKNTIVVRGKGILTLKNGGKVACIYPSKQGRHYDPKKA